MAMTTLSSMAAVGPHVLPPLPYVEGALSPFISARTVGLHRDQHHQGYVDALNKAVVGTPYADLSLQQIVSRHRQPIRACRALQQRRAGVEPQFLLAEPAAARRR